MKNTNKIQLLYSILLSIFIVLSGICLIIACLGIYNSGEQPYSRESVANAFNKISIPIYICLALTLIGFIMDIFSTKIIKKASIIKPYNFMLNNMYAKRDLENCDSKTLSEIKSISKKRILHKIIRIVVIIICSFIFLIYALNKNNFHQSDINGSVIKAMYVLLPCMLIAFGYSIFTIYYEQKSIISEIALLDKLPKKASAKVDTNETKKDLTPLFRYVLLLVGIILLIYGFITGGTVDVLTKAVNICTECIGLG